MSKLRLFLGGRAGATAVEYAMIAALVSIAIVAGATAIGQGMAAHFQYVGGKVAAVPPN